MKTRGWKMGDGRWNWRGVLDCGGPPPLLKRLAHSAVPNSAGGPAHSKTWRSLFALLCSGFLLSAFSFRALGQNYTLAMTKRLFTLAALTILTYHSAAFEGRLTATCTLGGQPTALLYTIGTNCLRLEVTGSTRPDPVDVLDRNTGELTLFYPHNRSFVHLPKAAESAAAPTGFPVPPGAGLHPASPALPTGVPPVIGPTNLPGMPAAPTLPAGLPPGVGPQAQMPNAPGAPVIPQMPGAPGMGGMGAMPAMPMMPMPDEAMELKATGEKTNLLGLACEQFEIKQRGELMEIWATRSLLPFQNYVRNQPPRFGPRMLEERWAGLLTEKKLFPLRASLRFENGPERFRFEVQAITPQKLKPEDAALFLPPQGYFEIQPLPF